MCSVYSAHTYTKFHESKSGTIHEVFPTRNMMVGISPTVNTPGLVESSAMGCVQALLPFWVKPAQVISQMTLLHKHNSKTLQGPHLMAT